MLSAGTMVQLVKDEHWQRVRKTLLGQWKIRPDWCCMQLQRFLGPISSTPDRKIIIVMNYLVGSGFRTGRIKHPCISRLRQVLSNERKKRKSNGKWNIKMIPKNR